MVHVLHKTKIRILRFHMKKGTKKISKSHNEHMKTYLQGVVDCVSHSVSQNRPTKIHERFYEKCSLTKRAFLMSKKWKNAKLSNVSTSPLALLMVDFEVWLGQPPFREKKFPVDSVSTCLFVLFVCTCNMLYCVRMQLLLFYCFCHIVIVT